MNGAGDEPLLELVGLTAGYDGVAVVHDVNLSVGAGEVVVLLGANGAGKTTTLSTISGQLSKVFPAPIPILANRSISAVSEGCVGQNCSRKLAMENSSRDVFCAAGVRGVTKAMGAAAGGAAIWGALSPGATERRYSESGCSLYCD